MIVNQHLPKEAQVLINRTLELDIFIPGGKKKNSVFNYGLLVRGLSQRAMHSTEPVARRDL
jgi:hypothetical protein